MITIPTSLFLIACQPSVLVSCGPGTHQVEDECVPIAATTSTTTETAEPITETSSKTTTSTITHITTCETGETGNDTATPIDDDTVDEEAPARDQHQKHLYTPIYPSIKYKMTEPRVFFVV